jgi:hypothetical protein
LCFPGSASYSHGLPSYSHAKPLNRLAMALRHAKAQQHAMERWHVAPAPHAEQVR